MSEPYDEVERLTRERVDLVRKRYRTAEVAYKTEINKRIADIEARVAVLVGDIGWCIRHLESLGAEVPSFLREHLISPITDPEGGDPLVGPVVCYACPMFEGAAHMPDAANHRPDPEGGDKR